jgi:hypothetical protein
MTKPTTFKFKGETYIKPDPKNLTLSEGLTITSLTGIEQMVAYLNAFFSPIEVHTILNFNTSDAEVFFAKVFAPKAKTRKELEAELKRANHLADLARRTRY